MVYALFATQWALSVLMQSLFQHRYAAHRMYTMEPRTERAMHLLTALVQGPSYLEPRAYAWIHREHHAFADTERDPHSPAHHGNVVRMMLETAKRYEDYVARRQVPESRFLGGYPEWPLVDRVFGQWPSRIAFSALYGLFYWRFATKRRQFLLLPVHCALGPLHGAIVNWCGHRYGYRNFATRDMSRNTLPVDALCMGELFQNNHHAHPSSPDFAARRFELDPTWQVMRLLARFGLIHIDPSRARALPAHAGDGSGRGALSGRRRIGVFARLSGRAAKAAAHDLG